MSWHFDAGRTRQGSVLTRLARALGLALLAVTLVAAPTGTVAPAQASHGLSTLEGVVFLDRDRDGAYIPDAGDWQVADTYWIEIFNEAGDRVKFIQAQGGSYRIEDELETGSYRLHVDDDSAVSVSFEITRSGQTLTVDAPVRGYIPSARVMASSDVVQAGWELSRFTFGDGQADRVVLARDDVFADSLSGTSVAGTDAPILFTSGGPDAPLEDFVVEEIDRVLGGPASTCGREAQVLILGGNAAVSAQTEDRLEGAGFCVERLWGTSRVETSLSIADYLNDVLLQGYPYGEVFIARSDVWADAIAVGPFALNERPVLLTPPDHLADATGRWLSDNRSDLHKVTLLGGNVALSDTVEQQTKQRVNATVRRLYGTGRVETSVTLAEHAHDFAMEPYGVAIVNGWHDDAWAYALALAPLAKQGDAPILYVAEDTIPQAVEEYVGYFDDKYLRPYKRALVAGPAQLVSDDVWIPIRDHHFDDKYEEDDDTSGGSPPPPSEPATPSDYSTPSIRLGGVLCSWDRQTGHGEVLWDYKISGGSGWTVSEDDNGPYMTAWNGVYGFYDRDFYVDPSRQFAGDKVQVGVDYVYLRLSDGRLHDVGSPNHYMDVDTCQ